MYNPAMAIKNIMNMKNHINNNVMSTASASGAFIRSATHLETSKNSDTI